MPLLNILIVSVFRKAINCVEYAMNVTCRIFEKLTPVLENFRIFWSSSGEFIFSPFRLEQKELGVEHNSRYLAWIKADGE